MTRLRWAKRALMTYRNDGGGVGLSAMSPLGPLDRISLDRGAGSRKHPSGKRLSGPKESFFAAPSTSPTLPAVRLRSFYGLILTWSAWSLPKPHGHSLPFLPIAPSARGSFACEPTLTQCASLNYRCSTCQELKEPHQRA
jgi:hypothetical protein